MLENLYPDVQPSRWKIMARRIINPVKNNKNNISNPLIPFGNNPRLNPRLTNLKPPKQ